jgi:hypothetical protein
LQGCRHHREIADRGSTAANTSMLLWEIDRPLTTLSEAYGLERAARARRASFTAVSGLKALVTGLGIQYELRDRNSVYLHAGATETGCWRSTSCAGVSACLANISTGD